MDLSAFNHVCQEKLRYINFNYYYYSPKLSHTLVKRVVFPLSATKNPS